MKRRQNSSKDLASWPNVRGQPGVPEKSKLGKQLLFFLLFVLACITIMIKGSIFDFYVSFFPQEESMHQKIVPRKLKRALKREFAIILSAPASGFESVQKDLIAWSKVYKIRPYSYVIPDMDPINYTKSQGSLQLMDAILTKVSSVPRGFDGYNITKHAKSDYLITEFQKEFNSLWMQRKNILIGTDHLSYFQSEKIRRKFLDRLIKLFPWNDLRFSLPGTNNDAKVILLYRSSRIKHLQALWSSSASQENFTEWLSSYNNFVHLDVFSTVDILARRGLKVDVIDVDYVVDNGQNLTKYILCEVIGLSCQSNSPLRGVLDGNVEPTKFMVSNYTKLNQQIAQLEVTMNEFACNFDFLGGKDVRFFPESLALKFSSCREFHERKRYDIAAKIQNITKQINAIR